MKLVAIGTVGTDGQWGKIDSPGDVGLYEDARGRSTLARRLRPPKVQQLLYDTIFALASGSARAAIAVLRLSGPASGTAVAALCGGVLPAPRQASLRRLRDPWGKLLLDQALVLWFPGPNSYTGEDCAELQLHGGRAVIDGVADTLTRNSLRPAEPGGSPGALS